MNNVSQITKAKRLTEEEVHAAAEELQSLGIKVSSIEVYRHLGRGSLTTITNFLKTWHQDDVVTTLPALVSLPDALSKAAEQLIVKLWAESQALAEQEINSQREILKQAEALAHEKIAEAEAFSEEQSKKIEVLEAQIEAMDVELDEQHEAWALSIKQEQDLSHNATMQLALCEQKLTELQNRFDYVNSALLDQQSTNQVLSTENTTLKIRLEVGEEKLKKLEEKIKLETGKQKELEDRIYQQECVIGEKIEKERRANEITRERDKIAAENLELIIKTSKLEGELLAWKSINPEKTPIAKVKQSSQKKSSAEIIPTSTPLAPKLDKQQIEVAHD